ENPHTGQGPRHRVFLRHFVAILGSGWRQRNMATTGCEIPRRRHIRCRSNGPGERYPLTEKEVAMRSIFTSRWAKASAAAAIAALGLVATTTGAEARYCAYWRHGYCADWRYEGYYYNPGPAAALNAFANVVGAAAAASQPRYYYPPP